MSGILTRSQESKGVQPAATKIIDINARDNTWSVAFLIDGKHVVSGGDGGKIRRWRVEDGLEVGTPMDTGSQVCNIAVSRNGKWIICGTKGGLVQLWNAEKHEKVNEFKAHSGCVNAVDVSPDSTRVASGSSANCTVCVLSLSTGQQLLGPWVHDDDVVAVKFSPNGGFIATATQKTFRIYDSQDGGLLVNVPIKVTYSFNKSLAWSCDSKRLFAVTLNKVICLDASTGATLSEWSIHRNECYRIALASDGALIAASSKSSVSFWDVMTHEQVGSVIQHITVVDCMAISANHDIVIGGGNRVTLRSLCNILPSSHLNDVSAPALTPFFVDRRRFCWSRKSGKQRWLMSS